MNLLTKSSERLGAAPTQIIGSTEDEICGHLGFSGKNARIRFNIMLEQFTKVIAPLGLLIRRNPLNGYWFVTQPSEIYDFLKANPFSDRPRLGATMCVILALSFANAGQISIGQIQELRKKKDIKQDLEDLLSLQYITVESTQVKIHPNLGYFLDFEKFFETLSQSAENSNEHSCVPPSI